MKLKYYLTAALAVLLSFPAMAQNSAKSLTLEDLMWGGNNYWSRQPKNIYAAFWGDKLVELEVEHAQLLTNEKGKMVKSECPLFTVDEVNAAIDTAKYGKVYNLMGAKFPYGAQSVALLGTQKLRMLYDWNARKVVWSQEKAGGEQATEFNTVSKATAYVKGWNLYAHC